MSTKSGTCSVCGCTDDLACADGCCWVNDEHTICSRCHANTPGLDGTEFNRDAFRTTVMIDTDCVTLLAVHGYLSLALRHPEAATRPSSEMAAAFARAILQACIDAGMFTERGKFLLANDANSAASTLPESLQALRNGGGA
jgi:hypothetical protein